ncbi:MAG: SRPBCC family protein [Gemmatimonadetes bacterium]|nr:SRPBCC family protein [Gemmatimonadota bacterium]
MRRVARVLGWTVGGIVALGLVALGIGYLLPVGHSATVSNVVLGTPQEVWDVITGVEEFDSWRTDIDRAVRLDAIDGWPAWREEGPSGAMTFAMAGVEPPTRLVTRIVDEGLGFGGTWTYELAPEPGGTQVTITENGLIYNPVFRLVARFFIGYESTLNTYLDALEARMQR